MECVGHGSLLHGLPSWISIVVLEWLTCRASSRESDADTADGISVLIRIGTCDSRDRHREVGGRTRQGALRHQRRDRPAHRALLGEDARRYAKCLGLVLF